jgi:hypothetical protein
MHSIRIATIALGILYATSGESRPAVVKASVNRTSSGEQVVSVEATFSQPPSSIWTWFSDEQRLKCWIAPVVRLNLKTGGTLQTNYTKTAAIGDAGTIALDILNYVEPDILTFKVKLNDTFSERLRSEDGQLQEIVQLQRLPNGGTRMVSSMVGWGTGEDWDKAAAFFARGNEWTYKNLATCVGGGRPSFE